MSIWGDGLEDLSLCTLWYPCSWNNVSEDELLLLIPSLVNETERHLTAGIVNPKPASLLRTALSSRALHVLNGSSLGRSIAAEVAAKSRPDSVRIGAAYQFLNAYLQDGTAADVALQHAIRDSASAPLGGWKLRARQLWCRHSAPDSRALFDLDCLALRAMATLLVAARVRFEGRNPDASGSPAGSGELQGPALPHVVLAALHTSFNPAYVYPELVLHHHLFAVAGWLGWLQRGRRAILPVFLAELLVEILNRVSAPSDAVLNYYAEEVVGRAYLLNAARRVLARGTASVIKPRSASHRSDPGHVLTMLRHSDVTRAGAPVPM